MRTGAALPRISNQLQTSFSYRSPLRYPGGKSRAVDAITAYFPKDLTGMISPFFGGGSVELYMAASGVSVLGFDIFPPLVEFWQCLGENPHELAAAVRKRYPLSKEDFYRLQKTHLGIEHKLDRAAIYYVLNRASFSGSTLSGGMSPGHGRFTPSSIARLERFYNPNVTVLHAPFTQSLLQHKETFAYLDPPYVIKSSLYGRNGNTHKNFDHAALASILKDRYNWLLSYNDCPEIRELYKGYLFKVPAWKYGMSSQKSSNEILIFSPDLS